MSKLIKITSPHIECMADSFGSHEYIVKRNGKTYLVRAHSATEAQETARDYVEPPPSNDPPEPLLWD
jgi:hypothetical protein